MVGCGKDEVQGMAVWQKASAVADPMDEDAMAIRVQDMLKERLVQEFRNGSPVKRATVRFIIGKDVYTDGSAKHVGTKWATGSASVVQYDEEGREQA